MKKLIFLFILFFVGIMAYCQSTRLMESNLTLKKTTPTFYLQGSGANINFNNDLSLTQSINKLTLSGGNFDLGSNNLLITGGIGNSIDRVSSIYVTGLTAVNYYSNLGASSIGTIADRILKGWFTSIEISTVPTISGVAMPVANWNTAYTDRLKWDGGNTDLIAADGRTSLGATTVGSAFFMLPNPSAITFPQITATNGVNALSAADFRTATATVGTADSTGVSEGNYMPRLQTAELVNDTIQERLDNAVIGIALADTTDGASDNDYVATPSYVQGYIGSGGGGSFTGDILKFIIGTTTGAPSSGDSTIIHSAFIGKQLDVYRRGDLHWFHTGAINTRDSSYRINEDTIFVRPDWTDDEWVEIRIREPISWNYLSLEGQESPLLDSLAVYYKLDETSGTAGADANDIQEAVLGAATTATTAHAKYNYNRHIGYKSQIRVPYNVNVNPDALFTVSAWIWADSIGASTADYIFAITNTATPVLTHRAYIDTDGKIMFRTYNSTGTEYSSISTAAISDSTVYHVVFVHRGDGKTNLIYVNNVDVTTAYDANYTFSGTLHSSNSNIYFGNYTTNGALNFRGYMDECAIWHQAFTPADVTLLYNSTTTHPFTE